jgi:hypothetical protein
VGRFLSFFLSRKEGTAPGTRGLSYMHGSISEEVHTLNSYSLGQMLFLTSSNTLNRQSPRISASGLLA